MELSERNNLRVLHLLDPLVCGDTCKLRRRDIGPFKQALRHRVEASRHIFVSTDGIET